MVIVWSGTNIIEGFCEWQLKNKIGTLDSDSKMLSNIKFIWQKESVAFNKKFIILSTPLKRLTLSELFMNSNCRKSY